MATTRIVKGPRRAITAALFRKVFKEGTTKYRAQRSDVGRKKK